LRLNRALAGLAAAVVERLDGLMALGCLRKRAGLEEGTHMRTRYCVGPALDCKMARERAW
jgi:hypothetical protein